MAETARYGVADDRPAWEAAVLACARERATRIEACVGSWKWAPWQLPWPVTRKGTLERIVSACGIDAAAELLLAARLRIAVSVLAVLGGACFFSRATPAIAVGGLLEAGALAGAFGARRRLRSSGVPLRGSIVSRWLVAAWRRARPSTPPSPAAPHA